MNPPLFTADRGERGLLRLTGKDRQSFLQGMVTNDVGSLTPGKGCYAFLLDATGHVLADAYVICAEGYLLLDVEPGMAAFVAETLEKYLIMEKVRITDVAAETSRILIGGSDAPGFLASLGVEGAANWIEGANAPVPSIPGLLAAATGLMTEPSFDFYGTPETIAELISLAQATMISPETLETLRIESGTPRFGVDIDARVLAPETGQKKRAIHYRKGCYIGQEIVARIDARGHTNRTFTGFLLGDTQTPVGSTLVKDDREVGRLTSTAFSLRLGQAIALGYVRHEFAELGTRLTVGEQEIEVAALPFRGLVTS